MAALEIRKTYKLYIGGDFVRSESGHYDEALDVRGRHRANLCRASRKDLRDAVLKARAAQEKWASSSRIMGADRTSYQAPGEGGGRLWGSRPRPRPGSAGAAIPTERGAACEG